jgi:hypothetical protein
MRLIESQLGVQSPMKDGQCQKEEAELKNEWNCRTSMLQTAALLSQTVHLEYQIVDRGFEQN